jgi:hypothetical protein
MKKKVFSSTTIFPFVQPKLGFKPLAVRGKQQKGPHYFSLGPHKRESDHFIS